MPLAKSNIETRGVSCQLHIFSDMPKQTEKRDVSQCKELVSPSKITASPSSAEDTVSNIL